MGNIIPEMGNNDDSIRGGLFGKTRRAVLALLFGHTDRSFYTKQILDAVGIGRGTVQRELKSLTEKGLIVREVKGRQVYYQANPECPIFDELRRIVRKSFGVADVIKESLAQARDRIWVSFIFGSIARNTDDIQSDVDVMIVGSLSFGDAVKLLSTAEETLGREVNPVVYSVSEFQQKVREDHHFVTNILEDDKIFVIGDDDELGRLAG
jgi:predicted nucleotidyltransferase